LLIPIIEKEVDGGGGEWRKQKVRRGSGKRRGKGWEILFDYSN